MNKRMSVKTYFKETLINALIIFGSYLLAVVIRYRILRSEPGIDALSGPYLMLALIYSLFMACTLEPEECPRSITHLAGMNSMFRTLSRNAIGCLLLLSVFYVTGIVNFSRWALVLFWMISTAGLILHRESLFRQIIRKRRFGQDGKNVLIIGDGPLARDYIHSVAASPQFGLHVAGYLGKSDALATDVDAIFDLETWPEPVIRRLGTFDMETLESLMDAHSIREVILADESVPDETAGEILRLAHEKGAKLKMPLRCSGLIRDESRIRDMGEIRQVELGEEIETGSVYPTGLVITAGMLLLLMITGKFHMGTLPNIKGFDSYRCIFFALFGFFLFLTTGNWFAGIRRGLVRRTGCVWTICMGMILVYEMIYSRGVWQNIRLDVLVTTAVLFICMIITAISGQLEQSNRWYEV